jgi:uncharacterized protein (DUF58 family)
MDATPNRPSRRGRRWRRVTPEGASLIGLAILLGIAAANSGLNLIYLLVATLIAFVLLGGALAWLSLRGLRASRSVPGHGFAGRLLPVEVLIRSRRRLWPSHSVRVREKDREEGGWIYQVPPGGEARLSYSLLPERRGILHLEGIQISTLFPFGFSEQRRRLPVRSEVIVFPEIHPFRPPRRAPAGAARRPARRLWGILDEEEYHGVREYREGDNPRWIHWKTSARTGSLVVKDFRTPRTDRIAVVLETHRGGRFLERGIVLAASILHDAHRRGRPISFLGHVPDWIHLPPDRGRSHLYRILEALARLEPTRRDRSQSLVRLATKHLQSGEQVYYISLGGRRPTDPGWTVIDVRQGEDRRFLREGTIDVRPYRP